MVPKLLYIFIEARKGFRAVLFRMVPKQQVGPNRYELRFRAVLFRMVPKLQAKASLATVRFRAVLFRMVPKPTFDLGDEPDTF